MGVLKNEKNNNICEKCGERDYYTKGETVKTKINGEKVEYTRIQVFCEKCQNEMFLPHIASKNLIRLLEAC